MRQTMRAINETLSVPFRGNALAVNVTFTLLLGTLLFLMPYAGPLALFGLPAVIILVPWFLKYCLVLGRHASYGRRDPPPLSMDNLSPLEVGPIALTVGPLVLYYLVASSLGPLAAVAVLALLMPPAVAVVIVEDSVFSALNPLVLVRYALGLGLAYPVLAAVLAGSLWVCKSTVESGAGAILTVFILQSVLLATFYGAGRLILARESAIDYTRPDTPEEMEVRDRDRQAQRELENALAEADLRT